MTPLHVIRGRRYVHVAAELSNGQRTARWSFDTKTGAWYVSEGWKRVGARRLTVEQVAFVESELARQDLAVKSTTESAG